MDAATGARRLRGLSHRLRPAAKDTATDEAWDAYLNATVSAIESCRVVAVPDANEPEGKTEPEVAPKKTRKSKVETNREEKGGEDRSA
jgi:hypothetical protein